MDKYTYSNLIIDPTKEGIESLIGKEVYCHDNPCLCLKNANKKSTDFLGVLVEIHKYNNVPFCVKQKYGVYKYTCIIEKKEEPKPKPKYIPFENVTEFLDAYRSVPSSLPDEVSYLSHNGIWLKDTEIDAYCMVTEIWDMGIVVGNKNITIGETTVFNDITSWEELLEYFTFLYGTPCGKLAEENKNGNSFDR